MKIQNKTKQVLILAAFSAVLSLAGCATTAGDMKTADVCADAQRRAAAGETLTPEQQDCANREISSEKSTTQPEAVPINPAGRPSRPY